MAKVIAKSDTHAGLRDKLQTAVTAKHGSSGDYYGDSAYISDVTDDKVVHSKAGRDSRGKLYASSYKVGSDGTVALGDPKEVEPAYKPLSESTRGITQEAADFQEATLDTKSQSIKLTIIQPGFNTSKTKFYPAPMLKKYAGIFENAKMFANHQTKAEAAARPEGSVHDWVANTGKVMVESDGRLTTTAKVHDKAFFTKLKGLKEAGLLSEMGVSIRAFGHMAEATVGSTKTMLVESFLGAKSVDFVTFPGAGGKVDMLESDDMHWLTVDELAASFEESDAEDIDLMPVSVLRERRPDLVQLITKEVKESTAMEKTVDELKTELAESNRKLTETQGKLTVAEEASAKTAVKTLLDTKLQEAKLPEVAEKRIRATFAEATKVDGIAEAITAEAEYIKTLGVTPSTTKPGVRKMGAAQESTVDATDKKTRRDALVSSFKASGMTQEAAEAAATNVGA